MLLMLALPKRLIDNHGMAIDASNRPNLYIGCGLTGAPEDFVGSVEALKNGLRNDYNVFDFVGLENGTEEDVYKWDIGHCVQDCDMLVGVCDYPAIGLGWELSKATELKKPVLAVAHESSRVTRLLLGAAVVEPNVEFHRYRNLLEDVPHLIAERFQVVRATLQVPVLEA